MFVWFKNMFSKVFKAFKSFITEVFESALRVFIGVLKDYAINVVYQLSATDLSNEAKRNEAFKKIKLEAIAKGLEVRDSWINILIEMALQYVKNLK